MLESIGHLAVAAVIGVAFTAGLAVSVVYASQLARPALGLESRRAFLHRSVSYFGGIEWLDAHARGRALLIDVRTGLYMHMPYEIWTPDALPTTASRAEANAYLARFGLVGVLASDGARETQLRASGAKLVAFAPMSEPPPIDLAVLGQDPRFGGGGLAQTNAFLEGARSFGRQPELLYEPHPGLGERRGLPYRIEAIHQLRAARRLSDRAGAAGSLWVVATMATNGGAAPRTGRRYACWIGTTIDSEWTGRAPGLSRVHRLAAGVSLPILRRLERRVLRGAARLYATSAASRASVAAAADVEEPSVGLLPIPVDVDRFVPESEETWLRSLANPILVFVGRADDPRKNVELLLSAATRLNGVRVRLIGEPPRHRVPRNVEAVGPVADVAEALKGATLFVLPSRQEGFGIVAAEALAAGLPVVTTPCGGPEELVAASGGGRVVGGFSTDELVAALEEVLEDGSLLAAMRGAGREYIAREHSVARFRTQLAAAMREIDENEYASSDGQPVESDTPTDAS